MFKSTIRAFSLTLLAVPFVLQASEGAKAVSTATTASACAEVSTSATALIASAAAIQNQFIREFNSTCFSLMSIGDKRMIDVLMSDDIEALSQWPAQIAALSDKDYEGHTLLYWANVFNAHQIMGYILNTQGYFAEILNHSASDSDTKKTLNKSASDSDLTRSAAASEVDESADSDNDGSGAQKKKKNNSPAAQRIREANAAANQKTDINAKNA